MSSEITSSTAGNCWWRPTAPRTLGDSHGFINHSIMSGFPKCCLFVRPLYGRLNCPLLVIVHGRRPWMASLWSIDKFHGRPHHRPRRTSSTVYFILSLRKLSLLSMIPVTIHFWSWTTPMDELEIAQIQYPIRKYKGILGQAFGICKGSGE